MERYRLPTEAIDAGSPRHAGRDCGPGFCCRWNLQETVVWLNVWIELCEEHISWYYTMLDAKSRLQESSDASCAFRVADDCLDGAHVEHVSRCC